MNDPGSSTYLVRQRGMVTLLVSLLLLTIASLATLAVGKAVYFEQKLTGSILRSKEVQSAATHGMEYAMDYLQSGNTITWSPDSSAGSTATIPLGTTSHGQSDTGTDSYTHSIMLTNLTDAGGVTVVQLASTATGVIDSHVSRTVTVNLVMTGILSARGGDAPPIVVQGCMSNVTGNPDLYPSAGQPAIASLSCSSTCPAPDGVSGCIDTGNFSATDSNGNALVPVPVSNINTTDGLWATIFGISRAQFSALAVSHPATFIEVSAGYESTGYYSSAYNGNKWSTDTGTVSAPVIMVFEATEGCPKINGGTDIVGVVFFEQASCSTQGWGSGTITGTVAITGDMVKHTANAELRQFPMAPFFGGGGAGAFNYVSIIPGSWRDF
ncbi:MAG: hypothetical protein ACI9GW_000928 [Halieaceae bacterium]|jgi:hypothetical protein